MPSHDGSRDAPEAEGTAPDPVPDPDPASADPVRALAGGCLDLLGNVEGLAAAYMPLAGLSARAREHLIVEFASASGTPFVAWVHGAWAGFVGPADGTVGLDDLSDLAVAAAEPRGPVDATVLYASLDPSVVRAALATVARAGVACEAERCAREVGSTFGGQAVTGPAGLLRRVAAAALALPAAAPSVAAAVVMRAATAVAPALPEVEIPEGDDANLVVHLVAESVPAHLGHAAVRAFALASPFTIGVAFRVDGTAATLRVGAGRVSVEDGVHPDALVVVDGPLDSVLRRAAASVARQLTGTR